MVNFKVRSFPEKNYRATYFDGKTIRQTYDKNKPILELDFPEFYDIKITNACTGNCPYCYQNSGEEHKGYENALDKIQRFFQDNTDNQKPFQVALGGGNPNQHKQFGEICEWLYDNGITPNYTTNGSGITDDIIEITRKYCGGVAITCHEHLESDWKHAVDVFRENNIKLNLHILIKDNESIGHFQRVFDEYFGKVDYFVLLPMMPTGRSTLKMSDETAARMLEWIKTLPQNKIDAIAFGANFYPYVKTQAWLKLSLYEPEIMSKYLDVKDMKVYRSSFDAE